VTAPLFRILFWAVLAVLAIVAFILLQGILTPFAASFVIAYLLVPLVDRLQSWGVPRSLAALAVLLVFLLGVALVLLLIVPLVQGEIVRLLDRLPRFVDSAQQQLGNLVTFVQQRLPAAEAAKLRGLASDMIGQAVGWLAGLLRGMITSSFAILSIVSLVVVTPVVTFFLLRDWHVMTRQVDAYLPRAPLGTIRGQFDIINDTLAGFVHGQALVCLILAAYYALALSVAGLESALAVGLLIGILAVIPVVGVAIGFVISLALAAVQTGTWGEILWVCGVFVVGQTVEANILTPKLVGDRIHLHPVWVIFALLAGGKLFGFLGVLVSVPAAAVIGVLVRFALQRYRRSPIYDPYPAAPICDAAPPDPAAD
jgi:predicted PurR-regulated permease PerM